MINVVGWKSNKNILFLLDDVLLLFRLLKDRRLSEFQEFFDNWIIAFVDFVLDQLAFFQEIVLLNH